MATFNQDFITFAGDAVSPIFTVQNSAGAAVDISTVSQISWSAQRNLDDTAALTKTKSAGQITFVTNGTDGKFQVALTVNDTKGLSGWYEHTASITDAGGNVTTVAIGRMNVGQVPNWTYDDGTLATEDIYDVRSMIGDTLQGDQQLTDQVIFKVLKDFSNNYMAAAECARRISALYARQVDVVQGELKTNYSMRAKSYRTLASDLQAQGLARGGATGYMGGISISDKQTSAADSDRVSPQFLIAMFDNLLPESPVGHQTNADMATGEDVSTETVGP